MFRIIIDWVIVSARPAICRVVYCDQMQVNVLAKGLIVADTDSDVMAEMAAKMGLAAAKRIDP